ncbi:MAG: hypothetical protein LQ340_005781, partial [Diploschistes diacapsis]
DFYEENRWHKIKRKLVDEPLIPFGCALTCYALWRASRSIRSGDHHQTNRMFRARIYAQFFTICCMIGGSYYYAEERQKRKVIEGAIAEKKVMEKKEAWIRELEARDEEDRQIRARKEAERKRLEETRTRRILGDEEDKQVRVKKEAEKRRLEGMRVKPVLGDEGDRQIRARNEAEKGAEEKKLEETRMKTVASSILEGVEERKPSVLEAVKELAGFRG